MNQPHRRSVAIFLLLSMMFMSAIFAVQGALLSAMIDAFQLNGSSQGAANAAAFAGGILALICSVFLQGRFRKRLLLKTAICICIVGLMLLWLVPIYPVFAAVWGLVGFGLGLMDTVLSASMADLYTGNTGTIMMCMLHTAFGLASVLTPIGFSTAMTSGIVWNQIYLIIAFAGALLLTISQVIRTALRIADPEVLRRKSMTTDAILDSIQQAGLIPLILAMFFHGIFLCGLNTWINRYADSLGSGIPAQSCLFTGIMFSRLLIPFLPISTNRYVRFGGLFGAAILALGLFTHNPLLLRITLVLSGLLAGALIPCMLSLGCEGLSGNTMLVTTPMMLSLYLGQSISSPIIASLESAFGLFSGIMLCAVCMAACSLSNWFRKSHPLLEHET